MKHGWLHFKPLQRHSLDDTHGRGPQPPLFSLMTCRATGLLHPLYNIATSSCRRLLCLLSPRWSPFTTTGKTWMSSLHDVMPSRFVAILLSQWVATLRRALTIPVLHGMQPPSSGKQSISCGSNDTAVTVPSFKRMVVLFLFRVHLVMAMSCDSTNKNMPIERMSCRYVHIIMYILYFLMRLSGILWRPPTFHCLPCHSCSPRRNARTKASVVSVDLTVSQAGDTAADSFLYWLGNGMLRCEGLIWLLYYRFGVEEPYERTILV